MKQPTKEQVLSASKECPDAKAILMKLFPEAFPKAWKSMGDFLDVNLMRSSDIDGAVCFRKDGNILFWAKIQIVKQDEIGREEYKVEDGVIYRRQR